VCGILFRPCPGLPEACVDPHGLRRGLLSLALRASLSSKVSPYARNSPREM
jgi:hypothetical protein